MSHGRVAKKHDCGRHGMLTAAQIAEVAGIRPGSASERIRRGVRGEYLCVPKVEPHRYPGLYLDDLSIDPVSSSRMAVACRIAHLCREHPPSVAMLKDRLGMSRANAYRWRRAWLDANGRQA